MDSRKKIYRSAIFWKIFGPVLLLAFLTICFTSYITISNYQAVFNNAIGAGACASSATHDCWTDFFNQTFIILGLFLAIVGFIVFIIARFLSTRINRILRGLKEISGGNLDARIEMDSRDEFSEIASSLNNLALKMKEDIEKEKSITKIKSDFVTIAAHQMRTPLSIIKWVFYSLKDDDPEKLGPEQLDLIEKGIITNERMINLIRDLLDVSRIEKGKFDYKFIKEDFRQILYEIQKSFQPQCQAAGIKLILDIYQAAVKINYDPDKMIMAMNNIMSNALKYTPKTGKIIISAQIKKDVIEIAVKDNGIGIPKNEQNKIFTSFFRGSNAKRVDTESSGLGLFITKDIIIKHGGDIWLISEDKQGSTFYFTLPINNKIANIKKSFTEFVEKI